MGAQFVEQCRQAKRRLPAADDHDALAPGPCQVADLTRVQHMRPGQPLQHLRRLLEPLEPEGDHHAPCGQGAPVTQGQEEAVVLAAQLRDVHRADVANELRLEPEPVLDKPFKRQAHADGGIGQVHEAAVILQPVAGVGRVQVGGEGLRSHQHPGRHEIAPGQHGFPQHLVGHAGVAEVGRDRQSIRASPDNRSVCGRDHCCSCWTWSRRVEGNQPLQCSRKRSSGMLRQ